MVSSVPDDLVIHFDRDLLFMVLRKAIFNGVKYCIFGGTVKVDAWRSSHLVVVSVYDSGAGMEPERVERTLSGGGEDKPIDELSFCKNRLEDKQAQMDILSEKGMGTTITLTFPSQGGSFIGTIWGLLDSRLTWPLGDRSPSLKLRKFATAIRMRSRWIELHLSASVSRVELDLRAGFYEPILPIFASFPWFAPRILTLLARRTRCEALSRERLPKRSLA